MAIPPVNEKIKARTVRLIDHDGENYGVISLDEAILRAKSFGMDLMAINIQSSPPVAKIVDVGKYKYEVQKKKQLAKKKQKVVVLKEIKFRPTIENHDYNVKVKAIKKFLEEGDKVKVSIIMRGREVHNKEPAFALVERLKTELVETAIFDETIKTMGRQIILNLSSRLNTPTKN